MSPKVPDTAIRAYAQSTHEFIFVIRQQVISPAALFLAAKVEEQPRKLEHVIKVAHACLNPQDPPPDVRSDVSVGL